MNNQIKWLKAAYLAGIITDALALIPMLYPPMAKFMWGFDTFSGSNYFSTGYGASLMAGWTLLLIWAYKRPVERKFVAFLTILVIIGFVATELFAVANGQVELSKMIPTWIVQMILLGLFGFSSVIPGKIAKEKQ